MKKSILNLVGAQQLSRNEQKRVNGGGPGPRCINDSDCEANYSQYGALCVMGRCYMGQNGL